MRRRRKKAKKSLLDYIALPRIPSLDLDPDTKRGIFIVFIIALGAISALSLFDLAGLMGRYLGVGLMLSFGWGKWIIPIILMAWGYMLYDEERFEIRGGNYLGMLMFILSFHTLLFLFVEFDQWPQGLAEGFGGGYAGFYFAGILIKLMGFIAALLVSLGLFIVSILLLFNTTLGGLFGKESFAAKILMPINMILAKLFNSRDKCDDEDEDDDGEEDEDDEDEDDDGEEDEDDEDEDDDGEEDEDDEDEDEEKKKKSINFKSIPLKEEEGLWWKPTNLKIDIPLSLLDGKREKPTSGNIAENKEIIQKALNNFGVPVDMGDVSVGPTVTQFTFRPAEGIKLSKIINLSNDLALALAAHPIRIEAPIPGKHLVGVEVPNQAKAVVSLKEVLNTKTYKERKSNTMMAMGKDVAGNSWFDDISKMPHLLVAGATNSGKSVCLNSIIVGLMYQNNPDDLRFIMVDPKRVELPVYNGIPYLLTPVITDVAKTINALKWCINEMDRRFDMLSKHGKRNIQVFNESADIKMPYIVFIIDELADLMVAAARDIEVGIIRLAQMARAIGIHLILATQRPSVDVITGLIKANMPARIAFSVASGTDSRTILDSLGAEKLLGRGDMLFLNTEISKPVRLQGAYLSDEEIKKIVRFVKKKSGNPEYVENITDKQKVHAPGGFGFDGGGGDGDEDELFHEAKETIINMGKASASLLQRKLRIGYARAASILDQLEEAGVVGPVNGAKPREILIDKAQFAALENQGVSGMSLHSREDSKAPDSFLNEEEENRGMVAFKGDENEDEDGDDDEDSDNEENNSDDEDQAVAGGIENSEEDGDDDEGGGDEESEEDEEEEEEKSEEDDDKEDKKPSSAKATAGKEDKKAEKMEGDKEEKSKNSEDEDDFGKYFSR